MQETQKKLWKLKKPDKQDKMLKNNRNKQKTQVSIEFRKTMLKINKMYEISRNLWKSIENTKSFQHIQNLFKKLKTN